MSQETAPDGHDGPLAGIVVLDLTRALAGPHAAMMLGDLGARVIKVEAPGTGDDTRRWGPPFVGSEDDPQSTYFLSCNRNKESIVLDLKDDEDRGTLVELIRRADVLLENFRVGVLERLGFSTQRLHELNPMLVIMSITGFGHDGPEAQRSGYDQILQGEAGLMSITGPAAGEPQKVGVPIADLLSGMYGAFGVVSALLERVRRGTGSVVRTSLLASIVGVHAFQGTRVTVAHDRPRAVGNRHPSIAPYGLFACRGGAVQISVGSERLWESFAEAFGLDASDPAYASNADRVENHHRLTAQIESAFQRYTAAELLERLAQVGVPAGRVRTLEEVYEWEQLRSQGLAIEVEHASLGTITLPGPPLRFFDPATGVESTRIAHSAPPLLDADADAIRAWITNTGDPDAGHAKAGTGRRTL